MATWGDQTCQRFEATAVGFEIRLVALIAMSSCRYQTDSIDCIAMSSCRYQTDSTDCYV